MKRLKKFKNAETETRLEGKLSKKDAGKVAKIHAIGEIISNVSKYLFLGYFIHKICTSNQGSKILSIFLEHLKINFF